MTINKTLENGVCTLFIEGRIDTLTAPQLEQAFADNADSCDKMIFDMSNVDYISSAGLRVLLAAQKIMSGQGTMKVIHVNDVIMEIFEVTGFTDILAVE